MLRFSTTNIIIINKTIQCEGCVADIQSLETQRKQVDTSSPFLGWVAPCAVVLLVFRLSVVAHVDEMIPLLDSVVLAHSSRIGTNKALSNAKMLIPSRIDLIKIK